MPRPFVHESEAPLHDRKNARDCSGIRVFFLLQRMPDDAILVTCCASALRAAQVLPCGSTPAVRTTMNISRLDHLVLTSGDLRKTIDFYGRVLGLPVIERNGRFEIHLGTMKINIHARPGEFLPAAADPRPGTLDFCLVTQDRLEDVLAALVREDWPVELGPVARHGALGPMQSLYLRDPDGNLVEIARYDDPSVPDQAP